jgi:hypothetical protein
VTAKTTTNGRPRPTNQHPDQHGRPGSVPPRERLRKHTASAHRRVQAEAEWAMRPPAAMLVVLWSSLVGAIKGGVLTTRKIGHDTVVYIIDDFMGAAAAAAARHHALVACAFAWARHAYPGIWCRNRRSRDSAARYSDLANAHLEQHGLSLRFDGRDSFFGVVANRSHMDFATAPHIDFHSETQYAAVHYLFYAENTSSPSGGTAFFRDKATGIERFRSSAQCSGGALGSSSKQSGGICKRAGVDPQAAAVPFMTRDDPWYEVLAIAAPKFDRFVLYPSNQIHGAWMDHAAVNRFLADGGGDTFTLSERAREGRLTSNLFGKRILLKHQPTRRVAAATAAAAAAYAPEGGRGEL